MTDLSRSVGDGETPVNPYSLLEAVNDSSETAHMGWLIFIAIMSYIMIAVAGVTHKDLLLETPVTLPILQVSIPQGQFFQFAPALLVLFHLGLVSQLVLLARKTLEFDSAVRALEPTDKRSHPLRLELHNFFFVQAVAGPHRSIVMSAFLHGMSWLTLVILPVVLLLFVQIKYLPYHDVTVTWMHRIALGADIFILGLIGVFLTRTEASFFQAFFRSSRQHPVSFVVTGAVLVLVSFFSFFVATVPGEALDRPSARGGDQAAAFGFSIPFLTPRADGTLFGLFHRNLVVTDTDLVPDASVQPGEASLNLRGRDLRYARLDRSDLHQADLTGADLTGASLVGADLRGVRLTCADLNAYILTTDRGKARCGRAMAADFTRSQLGEARFSGLDASGARFEDVQAVGADFSYADLADASFAGAHLERAEFTGGVDLQGANFLLAHLQGADLTGAALQFADFSNAQMAASNLAHAGLEGAVLRDAELEGADLRAVRLFGADLTGARLRAVDLREAAVWMTDPPGDGVLDLGDLTDLRLAAPDAADKELLTQRIDRADDGGLKARLKERLAEVLAPANSGWNGGEAWRRWRRLADSVRPPEGSAYSQALTEHLTGMACKPRWSRGYVATGVAKRALGPIFRGSLTAVAARIKADDCPGGRGVPASVAQALAAAADAAP